MADAEDVEVEEPPPEKRVRKAATEDEYHAALANPDHGKVVCVAWLRPGDKHCAAPLAWFKAAQEDPLFQSVLVLQCDPQQLPGVAEQLGLCSVPTFQYHWRDAQLFAFSGNNELKFKAYLEKALKVRHAELSIPKAWQRTAEAETALARGDRWRVPGAALPALLTLGLGWKAAAQDDSLRPQVALVLAVEDGKAPSDQMVVRADQPQVPSGAVSLVEPEPGEDADDVSVLLRLEEVDVEVWEILVLLFLPEGKEREVPLGSVAEGIYVRLYDREANAVHLRYLCEDDAAESVSILLGKLAREGDDWVFHAMGDPGDMDLDDIRERFVRQEKKKKKK
eukprot:EG_transcript_17236